MNEKELKEIGREVASALVKGMQVGEVKPTSLVPLAALLSIADQHGVAELEPGDFTTVAKSMEEALQEAARWNG